jgi:hypothetical protein
VEVKAPDEILRTLDTDGTLDRLPFMPEMLELCGRRFPVSRRVLKTCYTGLNLYDAMRRFRGDDVVTLEGVRCSGAAHDGCQKACMIFWREAWLRKVEPAAVQSRVDPEARERLRARLKTSTGPQTYFCQASELLNATRDVPRREQLRTCVSDVRAGNCTLMGMAHRIATWLYWKIRRRLLGEYARGRSASTPVAGLNLSAGEWIEVKSMASIRETLNEAGYNRGLYFTPDMRRLCGGQHRVGGRIDKIIVDGTGEMRQLRNTVRLEGSLCGCDDLKLGGCSRAEVSYWREIWLRRIPSNTRR